MHVVSILATLLATTSVVTSFVPTAWQSRSSPGVPQLHPVFQPPVPDSECPSWCYTGSSSSKSSTALQGIPKMFRWLTDQYPDILNRQLEAEGLAEDISVDNFYLDMNGIIHPCTHGNAEGEIIILDGKRIRVVYSLHAGQFAMILDADFCACKALTPLSSFWFAITETAMFKKIFLYVDRYVPCVCVAINLLQVGSVFVRWARPERTGSDRIGPHHTRNKLCIQFILTQHIYCFAYFYITAVCTKWCNRPRSCTWQSTVSLRAPR
jgi:hypothetical protein